jgi:hypothetical protein
VICHRPYQNIWSSNVSHRDADSQAHGEGCAGGLRAEYQKRLRSLAAAAEVADGVDPGAEINMKGVLDCFAIWCSNALCDEVTTMFDGRSLDDIWTQFGVSYAKRGGGQLAGLMKRPLALPASQTAIERAIKSLGRIWEKCGPQLGADVELARLLLAACPSVVQLRAQAIAPAGLNGSVSVSVIA